MKNSKNVRNNNVFGFETDTVWGLGCCVSDKIGADKIYEIKGRDRSKPLILMSYDKEIILKYVRGVSDTAKKLMDEFWPGGLTLIFRKSKLCPKHFEFDTLAVRIPNHPLFKEVCNETETGALLTTSLNFSNEKPVESYEEAVLKFGNLIKIFPPKKDFKKQNVPSTIVDFSSDFPKILRRGVIDLRDYIF